MLPPEPELTPDLEWMLQSVQVSDELLVETITQEHGAELQRLAEALCAGEAAGRRCLTAALIQAARRRREYLPGLSPRVWLAGMVVDACRRETGWRWLRPRRQDQPGRPDARMVRRVKEADPGGLEAWQVDLWLALDLMAPQFRLPVLLHYLHGLSQMEISAVLGDKRAPEDLAAARRWLAETLPGDEANPVDRRIAQELERRWPLPEAGRPELREAARSALQRLRPSRRAFSRLGGPQQAGLLALMAVFVSLAGWLTQQAAQSTPRRAVVTQVVHVTRVITPTYEPSATPQPLPPPLEVLTADAASLNLRMLDSRYLWSSLWVEALLVDYGPIGYIGPARTYRSQMWVQNPTEANPHERRLVVSGTTIRPGGGLFQVGTDLYEIDLPTGLSTQRTPSEAFEALRDPARVRAMTPNRWLIHSTIYNGSALARLLYSQERAQAGGRLKAVAAGRLLGRQVLEVERTIEGRVVERLWLDAVTGLTLRWFRFAGDEQQTVIEEMQVLGLVLEAPFPAEAVTSPNFWRQPVTWEGISAGEPVRAGGPLPQGLNPRTRISFALHPGRAVDFSQARLILQWDESGVAGLDPTSATDIYVQTPEQEGYRIYGLGRVQLGNPWGLACERSPDGLRIAFTLSTPRVTDDLYAHSGPFWLDLRQPGQVTNALPEARVVSRDFTFSPDSTRLAFWGCAGVADNCAIYIHDLESGETRSLFGLAWGATYFRWSPDGQQLAAMGLSSTQEFTGNLVVDVNLGSLVDGGPIRWPELSLPGDAPVIEWGSQHQPAQPSLEDCLGWP